MLYLYSANFNNGKKSPWSNKVENTKKSHKQYTHTI